MGKAFPNEFRMEVISSISGPFKAFVVNAFVAETIRAHKLGITLTILLLLAHSDSILAISIPAIMEIIILLLKSRFCNASLAI